MTAQIIDFPTGEKRLTNLYPLRPLDTAPIPLQDRFTDPDPGDACQGPCCTGGDAA